MSVIPAKSPEAINLRPTHGAPLDVDLLLYDLAIRGWNKGDLAKAAGIANSTVTQAVSGLPLSGGVRKKIGRALKAQAPDPELVRLTVRPA